MRPVQANILSQFVTSEGKNMQEDLEEVKTELEDADISMDTIKFIKN